MSSTRARRIVAFGAILLAVRASAASAEDVTLPAAASIVGGAPFFSDVRAFNTSYASALDVTARYRCFIPSSCSAGVPEIQFTLAPRESRAFNDIVAATFNAPDTAGGVEFDHSGGDEQLVVTSRLYSTVPQPTVGMFAVVVVEASHEIFSYAAVIDNFTSDPIFVRGAKDQSAPAPTPSPTPGPVRVRRVALGPGFQFRDEAEGGGTSRIPVGTTIEWVWEGGGHSTTSGPCTSATCMADGNWNSGVRTDGTFRLRFGQPGTFPYFCDPHSDQMRGVVIVSP